MSLRQSLIVSEYQFTASISKGYKVMKFPCQYMLTWKSGTQKASGNKSIQSQQSGVIQFDDQLKLTVKVSQNPSTGEYERKKSMIYINLKTQNHPEFRQIGHVVIDLGQFIDNPRCDQFIEYSFQKDKESKLLVKISCSKVRDVNPLGYTPDQQKSSSYFATPDSAHKQLQNSRHSERSTYKQISKQAESISIKKLTQQLQLSHTRHREQEKIIFNLKMSEEQLVMNQIDLEGKIQELTDKAVNDELRLVEYEQKLEQLMNFQSELENLKWQNNQLKSEIETAKRINQIKQSMNSHEQSNSSIIETQNEKILKDKLFNIESECTSLLYSLKQREEGRQEIEQKFLMTEEECRNLNYLLEQKDIEMISLREKIESINELQQFNTPVKTDPITTVETNEMGIQYSDGGAKGEDRKEYLTPQPRKTEEEEKHLEELRGLKLEIELKNEEINKLLNNIMNIEQHKIENLEKEKKKDQNLKVLKSENQRLKDEIVKLNILIQNQQIFIKQQEITKVNESAGNKTQQMMKEKIYLMEQQSKTFQAYIKTLEEQNRQLSKQCQKLSLSTKNQQQTKQASVVTQQQIIPIKQKRLSQSPSPQKSRIKQLKLLVQSLQDQNKFVISKAKQEQQQNYKLRSKLHEAEQMIESLKKQINLDAQDIDLIKRELEKQKEITENVDSQLSLEKNIINQLTQKLHKTEEEYSNVSKELEELQLRRSRRRERKDQSKAKYEGEIKALSEQVIRLHEELFRMRTAEQMRENGSNHIIKIQEDENINLSRNLFQNKNQTLELSNFIEEIKNLRQTFESFPSNQTINTVLSLLHQHAKKTNKQISHDTPKLKQWIDGKLRQASISIQKLKTARNINAEERKRILTHIHPVEECISTILERSITDL